MLLHSCKFEPLLPLQMHLERRQSPTSASKLLLLRIPLTGKFASKNKSVGNAGRVHGKDDQFLLEIRFMALRFQLVEAV